MRPGHWAGLTGMVLYASATSCTDAWDPGGKQVMIRVMVANVPQVQGKLLQSMCELIEVALAINQFMLEGKIVNSSECSWFQHVFRTRDSSKV